MATEISRAFDFAHGRVRVRMRDDVVGNETDHAIYVIGPNAITDVHAHVEKLKADADTHAQTIKAAMIAAGWSPDGS